MRSPIRRPKGEQLHLFHTVRQSPTWQSLPVEVRERAVPLLARLLGNHLVRRLGGNAAREANDE